MMKRKETETLLRCVIILQVTSGPCFLQCQLCLVSFLINLIGNKAHIWDEIARAKGARPKWDYYTSRYCQQRTMSVQ